MQRAGTKFLLTDKNGSPARDGFDQATIIAEHYRSLTSSVYVQPEDLVRADRARSIVSRDEKADVFSCCEAFLAKTDLAYRLAASKTGLSPGPNRVVADVGKIAPYAMARILNPIAIETSLSMRPALQWKGALIATLLKDGRASTTSAKNRREIHMAGDCGKSASGIMRQRLHPYVGRAIDDSQNGDGFKAAECAASHLVMRVGVDVAEVRSLATIFLLVAVASAFATVCR